MIGPDRSTSDTLTSQFVEPDIVNDASQAISLDHTNPISTIPVEILERVFLHVLHSWRKKRSDSNVVNMTLALVCRFWKETVYAFKPLWSYIDLGRPRAAEYRITRACQAPLQLIWKNGASDQPLPMSLLRMSSAQVQSLTIRHNAFMPENHGSERNRIDLENLDFPRLEHLSITCLNDKLLNLSFCTPLLESLRLSGVDVDWNALMETLKHSLKLRHLHLVNLVEHPITLAESPFVFPPCLRYLKLSWNFGVTANIFLKLPKAPSRPLIVHITESPYEFTPFCKSLLPRAFSFHRMVMDAHSVVLYEPANDKYTFIIQTNYPAADGAPRNYLPDSGTLDILELKTSSQTVPLVRLPLFKNLVVSYKLHPILVTQLLSWPCIDTLERIVLNRVPLDGSGSSARAEAFPSWCYNITIGGRRTRVKVAPTLQLLTELLRHRVALGHPIKQVVLRDSRGILKYGEDVRRMLSPLVQELTVDTPTSASH